MSEKRIILYLSFGFVFLLTSISGILIFLERGGAAKFDILGQNFSSTNMGMAVLFLAVILFLGIVRYSGVLSTRGTATDLAFTTAGEENQVSWNQVIDGVHKLVSRLTATEGFRPDLIVGICGGGLVIADVISKRLGHIPCISLWPDRNADNELLFSRGQAATINMYNIEEIIHENRIRRILLVDDAAYGGGTLKAALRFLNDSAQSVRDGTAIVKTATIFALREATPQPDYVAILDTRERKMMPASNRLR